MHLYDDAFEAAQMVMLETNVEPEVVALMLQTDERYYVVYRFAIPAHTDRKYVTLIIFGKFYTDGWAAYEEVESWNQYLRERAENDEAFAGTDA